MLSARQERILRMVVDDYLRTGQPVPSRAIAQDRELDCSPSTVRNELALLEDAGLLMHPHVSAGRVPTDAGHRYEVDEAVRTTTETLSQMTNLLAVVSAPAISTATVRHVEVLELQPQVVMVVIITSTGAVSKMLATFDRAVDPGLVGWAGEYLNERLVGRELGARMLQTRLVDPDLSPT